MTNKSENKSKFKLPNTQIAFLILLIIFLTLVNLTNFYFQNKTTYVLSAQDNKHFQILFWHDFLNKHPDYISGWIRLAQLEYERGNIIEAQSAFWKAYDIDRNSLELSDLRSKLKL